jgi:hypothetical protein
VLLAEIEEAGLHITQWRRILPAPSCEYLLTLCAAASSVSNGPSSDRWSFGWQACFERSAGLAQKQVINRPVVFWPYLKDRQLHLWHAIPASNRLPFKWSLGIKRSFYNNVYWPSLEHLSLRWIEKRPMEKTR